MILKLIVIILTLVTLCLVWNTALYAVDYFIETGKEAYHALPLFFIQGVILGLLTDIMYKLEK
jgi:hypothetical protein